MSDWEHGADDLRDHFAGYALMGLLIARAAKGDDLGAGSGEILAQSAYELADAMVKARGAQAAKAKGKS